MSVRWWPTGGLWRHPDFLRLWGAQAVSAFGSRITRTVLPIIAIDTIGASAAEVAVLAGLGVAPGVLVGLFVGGRVDRTARRPLLVGADLARALLVFTIPAAAWLGVLSMPQLYVVAAAVGAATTLFQIADNSYLPALVDRERLVEGNAKLEATEAVAESTGPGMAGVLAQLLTAPFAVVVDGVSYVASALLLGRIRAREEPAPAAEAEPTVLGDVATGFRAAAAHPLVGPALLAEALMYLCGGFFMALYMLMGLETLDLSPAVIGLVIGVGGVGSFAGAVMAEPLARLAGTGRAMVLAMLVGTAANLLVPLSLSAGPLAIPCLVAQQLVGDAFLSAFLVYSVSLRQRVLPPAVLGRASATFHVANGVVLPAGALLAGMLAGTLGIPATLWIGACGGLLAAPVLLRPALLRLR